MKNSHQQPRNSTDSLVGRVLGGRYTLTRFKRSGEDGSVYLATQAAEPREVVIKILEPKLDTGKSAVDQLKRAAENRTRVQHPNIASMLDFGQHDGFAYCVLEQTDGELLSDYLNRHRILSIAQFVPIAAQVLKAVDYAHARDQVLHDIHPTSILLCVRGKRRNFVKFMDFGLARLRASTTGAVPLGALGFVAPECLAGSSATLKADVYALGVLFYLMLSGRMPQRMTDSDPSASTDGAETTPLQNALPPQHDVPQAVINLVNACVAVNAAERPASAHAIVERLIDAVPAALFKLPVALAVAASADRAPGATSGKPHSSANVAIVSSGTTEIPVRIRGFWQTRAFLAVGAVLGLVSATAISQQLVNAGEAGTQPAALLRHPAGAPTVPLRAAVGAPLTKRAPAADPRPKAPKKPEQVAKSSLTVATSPPGAALTIDGQPAGTSPHTAAVAAGSHEVRASLEGYKPTTTRVEVGDGPTPLTVRLQPTSAEAAAPPPRADRRPARARRTRRSDPSTKESGSVRKASNCDVPFRIDRWGVKRFKPECL